MARHNELRDGVVDLAGKSFTLTHVRDDPLIFEVRAVQRTKAQPTGSTRPSSKNKSEATEQNIDLLIRKLW